MKIFIIGPAGSGKTTVAKKISYALNIETTYLDDLFWKNDKDSINIKRENEERTILFNEILKKENWIIEGAYVEWPLPAMKEADCIVYMNIPKIILHKRIWIRFIRRKMLIEQSNKKESLKSIIELTRWNRNQIKLINKRIKDFEENGKRIIEIKSNREVFEFINNIKKEKAF